MADDGASICSIAFFVQEFATCACHVTTDYTYTQYLQPVSELSVSQTVPILLYVTKLDIVQGSDMYKQTLAIG